MDIALLNALYAFANYHWLISFFVVVCAVYLSYATLVFFIAVAYLSRQQLIDRTYLFFLSAFSLLVARGFIVETVRFFYARPRPYETLDISSLIGTINTHSMPSGHATTFFALATLMFFVNKKYVWHFGIIAGIIGIARVMAGVHWPSDILAGAFVGVVSVLISRYFLPRS